MDFEPWGTPTTMWVGDRDAKRPRGKGGCNREGSATRRGRESGGNRGLLRGGSPGPGAHFTVEELSVGGRKDSTGGRHPRG